MNLTIKKIELMVGTLSTAFDVWLATICIIHVLGKPIPWYVWTLAALELLLCILNAVKWSAAKAQG